MLLDDRDVRAGVKFKDADLVGIPLRVVIGERGLKDGKLEIKWRWDKQAELIDLDTAAETIIAADRRGARRQPTFPQPFGVRRGRSVTLRIACLNRASYSSRGKHVWPLGDSDSLDGVDDALSGG